MNWSHKAMKRKWWNLAEFLISTVFLCFRLFDVNSALFLGHHGSLPFTFTGWSFTELQGSACGLLQTSPHSVSHSTHCKFEWNDVGADFVPGIIYRNPRGCWHKLTFGLATVQVFSLSVDTSAIPSTWLYLKCSYLLSSACLLAPIFLTGKSKVQRCDLWQEQWRGSWMLFASPCVNNAYVILPSIRTASSICYVFLTTCLRNSNWGEKVAIKLCNCSLETIVKHDCSTRQNYDIAIRIRTTVRDSHEKGGLSKKFTVTVMRKSRTSRDTVNPVDSLAPLVKVKTAVGPEFEVVSQKILIQKSSTILQLVPLLRLARPLSCAQSQKFCSSKQLWTKACQKSFCSGTCAHFCL